MLISYLHLYYTLKLYQTQYLLDKHFIMFNKLKIEKMEQERLQVKNLVRHIVFLISSVYNINKVRHEYYLYLSMNIYVIQF